MAQWITNGVKLGWLIDADAETVYVYRPAEAMQEKHGIQRLDGQGPVKGLALNLRLILQGRC